MTNMTDGEKLFLGVVLFLVLRGLLDPKDAEDRDRVRETWDKYRRDKSKRRDQATLFPVGDEFGREI